MPRRFYVILTLATLVGAFLRLWQLTSVPPGLHFDLAATALLGNEVAFHGSRPIFIAAYTGHEVLFYYWLALWFRLIGSSIFTLRLAAALLGILTIPAAFFAVREVLRFEEKSLQLAAFAAIFLSFAFFHVVFSRFGFRVITEPFIQCLALGFLFRGLHCQSSTTLALRPWSFVLSGFFTGLAAYTYLAARLFPIPLAIFWIVLLLGSLRHSSFDIRHFSFVIKSFTLFTLSALLTFAPLGLYFLQHPEDFLNRFGQVAPQPGESALLLEGIRRAAEMIFINGEPYDRFNIPGLPLFGPVLGFFFIIGLAITIHNLLRPSHPVTLSPGHLVTVSPAKTANHALSLSTELLLLSWLPAMLLPTALSIHDIFPSNVRAFGLIPLLFVFPARGLLACLSLAKRVIHSFVLRPSSRVAVLRLAQRSSVIFFLSLTLGPLITFNNYFFVWAKLPNQRLNNDADLVAIADYLNTQEPSDTALFVSALYYRHPTLAYLARDYNSILWLTEGNSLVVPENRAALYLFPRAAPPPEEWIKDWSSHLVAIPNPPSPPCKCPPLPDFDAYRFAAGESPPLPDFTPVTENFGNIIFLTDYRLAPRVGQIFVDLRWRVENLPEAPDILPYARLYDAHDEVWSQSGGFSYPSEQWSPGDMLLTRLVVPLPKGLPPGSYTIKIGLYAQQTQINLPRLNAKGQYAGERAPLPAIPLPAGPWSATEGDLDDFLASTPLSEPAQVQGLDRGLALLGYATNSTVIRQGERLHLTLFWHAYQKLSADTLTLQLADQILFTGQPVYNTFPFSEWAVSQIVIDRYGLKVPPNFAPGPAELAVNVPGYGSAILNTLEVKSVERVFSAPEPLTEAGDDFNHEIILFGYDLKPGAHTTLTLFWKSLAATDADYTVFVHILDASGQVVAQTDAPPRAGAYPTSLWVPGEFIADAYAFDLSSGTYTIEVGLYLPETGERLSVFDAAGNKTGSAVTLPAFQVP